FDCVGVGGDGVGSLCSGPVFFVYFVFLLFCFFGAIHFLLLVLGFFIGVTLFPFKVEGASGFFFGGFSVCGGGFISVVFRLCGWCNCFCVFRGGGACLVVL
ncbi:hypothetical protein LXA28_17845, partial [Erwinia amylovora]|uniref:hypothetical protein n=1 Tax=Erwinia amylovora TaxID=552 RepID=UPI0020BDA9AC